MHNKTNSIYNLYSIDNPAFCSYLIVISLLILKMMATTLLIIFHRMRTKSFISEEDAAWKNGDIQPNKTVERVRSYLIVISLLILKMMATTLLIIFHRMRTKSFISEEDAAWKNGDIQPNKTVERVRRAYQNDLEGIIIFMIISLGYLSIEPPLWGINVLYLVFLITRTLHTLVYAVYVVRQPTRAILWAIGFLITGYMAIHTALFALIKGYL